MPSSSRPLRHIVPSPIITLTTDFGLSDPYVGSMKGVILSINPQATIVDITHGIRPQAIDQAAFLISKSHTCFPPDTIHIVVVDPGVGTSRRALVVVTPQGLFLAPDNGVLGLLGFINRHGAVAQHAKAYSLTQPAYWRSPVSHTFHGRDIFAPVAAHLSLGVDPSLTGHLVPSLTPLPHTTPIWQGNTLQGHIVHIDHYGNLVTDIEAHLLHPSPDLRVQLKGLSISGLSNSYAEGPDLLAIIGSFDTLEVAARNASAEQRLAAYIGDPVQVSR